MHGTFFCDFPGFPVLMGTLISVKFHFNIPRSKGTTGKKHFLIQSRADNSQTGKVRVTILSHNMLPLM